MRKLSAVAALCLLLFMYSKTNAQSSLPEYELGLQFGAVIYQGDLTPDYYGAFNTVKPAFGISVARNINTHYALRFHLLHGSMNGDDASYRNPEWRKKRGFTFQTPVTEISLQVVRNVLSLHANDAGIINFVPYVFGGISYSFLNIKRDWSRFNDAHFSTEPNITNGLAEDLNKKLPKAIVFFPVGAGVRYGINEKFSFNIEGTYQVLNNDYLDGFSQSANPGKNDHYHSVMLGLIYSLGKRNKFDCPRVGY
jgi:hypothetical protein